MKFIILFVLGLTVTQGHRIRRFAGGRDAKQGEITYQVQLRLVADELKNGVGEGYNCTGVLLSREIVITTVGCVYDKLKQKFRDPSDILVAAGQIYRTRITGDLNIRGVSEYVSHPNQTRTSPYLNNIAVLLLEIPFPEEHLFIKPIQMWDKPDFTDILESNIPCHASGWGRTRYAYTGPFAEVLQVVDVTLVNQTECAKYDAEVGMICAGAVNVGGCRGDGGAPLVCDGKLVGINSFAAYDYETKDCASDGEPDIYTDVLYHKGWIQETVTNLLLRTNLV